MSHTVHQVGVPSRVLLPNLVELSKLKPSLTPFPSLPLLPSPSSAPLRFVFVSCN